MTVLIDGALAWPAGAVERYRREGYWGEDTLGDLLGEWAGRYGDAVAVVRKTLEEMEDVAALVLGAAATGNPGKLVSHFAGADAGKLPCPIMVIPGGLDGEAIDRLS